ncbi:hypothetical protein GQX73_g10535 [Xylaria multiplex]|uniref:Ecp2 effector protein domain-containing protein n=1 Tax=Xylaria multiplex TaxID=323545 RepID=A0A7C8MI36_9PEZI|nr:hypothetical protein GQX73_g10535 [Xylaria multiplex]
MHIAFLLSALSVLGATTISSAVPQNASTDGLVADYGQYTKASSKPPHVPVEGTTCTGYALDKENFLSAKNNLIAWSDNGGRVKGKSFHAEMYPDYKSGVTWYICNCKWFAKDKALKWEIDDVEKILAEKCGELQSGWVWSKKWQKRFSVMPTDWYMDALLHAGPLCPPRCIYPS